MLPDPWLYLEGKAQLLKQNFIKSKKFSAGKNFY